MSVATAFPAMTNPPQVALDAEPPNARTLLSDASSVDTESEDGKTSGRSHTNSIGMSSTSSWQTEGDSSNNEELLEPKRTSIDAKMASVWTEEKENTVRKPYDYVVSLGGKAFRREFLFALNIWLQVDQESCEVIDRAVSMLHNSSLLIDDIEDESKQRRGNLSAHEVYGIAQTINSANYVYFEAQDQLRKLENWPQAFLVFNEELLNLHRGQGMELYWRDTLQPPSEADYLQMIANKTGGLFRMVLRLLQCVSKCEYDLEPLVDVIGLMFQILDDYKNLKDEKMSSEKGYCEDLTEGKFSLPISHAMWAGNSPHRAEILRILKTKPTDDMLKRHVVHYLTESGSLAYTKRAVEELYERARELLEGIPVRNPAVEKVVEKLVESVRGGA